MKTREEIKYEMYSINVEDGDYNFGRHHALSNILWGEIREEVIKDRIEFVKSLEDSDFKKGLLAGYNWALGERE